MDPLLEDEYLQPRRRRGHDDDSSSDPDGDAAVQSGPVSFDPYALDDIFGDGLGSDSAGPPSSELRPDDPTASGSSPEVAAPPAEPAGEKSGAIRVRVRPPGNLEAAPRSIRIAVEADERPSSRRNPGAKEPAGTLPPAEPAPKRKKKKEPKAFIPGSVFGAPSEEPEDDGFDFDSTEIDSTFESDLDRRFGDAARRMRERISQREAVVEEGDPRRGAKVALGLGCLLLATVGFLLGYRSWVTRRQDGQKQPASVSEPAVPGHAATGAQTPDAGASREQLPPLLPATTVEGKIKRAVNFGMPVYRTPKEER